MSQLSDRLDALTHKLLHKQLGQVTVNAADIIAGTVGAGVLVPAANVIPGSFGSSGGDFTFLNRKVTLDSTGVDNLTVKGTGATIRLESRNGADFSAIYRNGTVLRFWDSTVNVDRYHFEPDGQSLHGVNINGAAIIGPWPADTNFSYMGSVNKTNSSTLHYGMLIDALGENTYIAGNDIWFRHGNNGSTKAVFGTDGNIEFWNHQGGQKHKFWWDGEAWHNSIGVGGDNGYNVGIVSHNGWTRYIQNDVGWHTESRGAGMAGMHTFGNQAATTNNNETTIIARKISQGGWATAGISSFGENSGMVPYLSMHASGCCTTNWRKDGGASYVVNVNSGGGCDWVYAANHPICSERARKHNISVADEYGLKTVRGLKPHKFQYVPTSEDEIWQWEKWKYDRSIGIWTVPPSEHMGWDDWHVGYFAEEMQHLVPEVVGFHPDGKPKGIDYGNLVVVAIAAINELADKVEDLEAQLYAAR